MHTSYVLMHSFYPIHYGFLCLIRFPDWVIYNISYTQHAAQSLDTQYWNFEISKWNQCLENSWTCGTRPLRRPYVSRYAYFRADAKVLRYIVTDICRHAAEVWQCQSVGPTWGAQYRHICGYSILKHSFHCATVPTKAWLATPEKPCFSPTVRTCARLTRTKVSYVTHFCGLQ